MSQLTGYGLMAPAGRFMPAGHPGGYAAAPADERALPSLPSLLAALYLCSVPMLSTWNLSTSWIPQAIGVGVGVGWLIFGLVGGRRIVWAKPVMLYVLWALWTTTGLMVTLDTPYFLINYRALLKVMAITWVISQCVRSRVDLLTCLLLPALTSFVMFYVGADSIIRAASFQGTRETVGARAEGLLISNANDLGVFGIVVILAGLFGFWACRNGILKLVYLAPMPIGLYLVAAAGSRMAMIGVLLLGAGTYWFHLRKMGAGGVERKVAMLILGSMLAAGSIYYVVKNPFFFRLQAAFADQNAIAEQPRTQYFLRGLRATVEHPVFGLGLGGFALHNLGGHGNKSHYSHSVVTETLSCTGIPGFLLYFGSQLAFFNLVRKLRKASLPKHDAYAINLLMVAFWTFFIMSVFSVPLADRVLWPLHGAFCGYLVALKQRYLAPLAAVGFAR